MPSVLKRAWNIVKYIMVGLVAVLAILLVGVRLVGLQPYTVLSGSMEPHYHVGSMIYVREVAPTELEVGDPVTFYLNGGAVATHRIIEVLQDPNNPAARYFRTKGDANNAPDGDPFHSSKVIGKPIFSVPYLGYFSNFIQRQPGRSIALGGCTVLLIAAIWPSVLPRRSNEASAEDTADEQSSDEPTKG